VYKKHGVKDAEFHKKFVQGIHIFLNKNIHFGLLGPKGVGKSFLIKQVLKKLQRTYECINLTYDMGSRDFLQKRSLDINGNTCWIDSQLVCAMKQGKIAILDGIDVVSHSSIVSALQRLVSHNEVSLPDGTLLICEERYNRLKLAFTSVEDSKIIPIHNQFQIIGIGRVLENDNRWFLPEINALFPFLYFPILSFDDQKTIISHFNSDIAETLMNFVGKIEKEIPLLSSRFSTRQLIRICKRAKKYFPEESLFVPISQILLFKTLPETSRMILEKIFNDCNIDQVFKRFKLIKHVNEYGNVELVYGPKTKVEVNVIESEDSKFVPSNFVFHENDMQNAIIGQILEEFSLGSHILLIGNQGVGKNKIADRFLQLMNLPRQYIQLHRDSTIQSLTVCPAVEDGVVVFKDSPLVTAARLGHVLIIDEADKAPTQVTAILKCLIEEDEITLASGKRLYRSLAAKNDFIKVHERFRMIVLANRPGFPFLGNDFFGEVGQLFSCILVENPDKISEMQMLRMYGPSISLKILDRLSSAFSELREMSENGTLLYPYSTRELVGVVRHLERFSSDGVVKALRNTFDFDSYDPDILQVVEKVFLKYGIPMSRIENSKTKFLVIPPKKYKLEKSLLEKWVVRTEKPYSLNLISNKLPYISSWKLNSETKFRRNIQIEHTRKTKFSSIRSYFSIVKSLSTSSSTKVDILDVQEVETKNGYVWVFLTTFPSLLFVDLKNQSIFEIELFEYIASVSTSLELALINQKIMVIDRKGGRIVQLDLVRNMVSILKFPLDYIPVFNNGSSSLICKFFCTNFSVL
jgi:MoxR-like ATPase